MSKKPITAAKAIESLYKEWEERIKKHDKEPDVFTTSEIIKSTGWNNKKTLAFMKQCVEDGKAEPFLATRFDMWDRKHPNIPAIKLISEDEDEPLQNRLS